MTNMGKILKEMQPLGLDALLLRDDISCRYATGAGLAEGTALIMPEKSYYFTDSRYIEAAERDIEGFEIRQITTESGLTDQLAVLLNSNMSVGFEEGRTTVSSLEELKKKIPASFVRAGDIVAGLRKVKEDYELDCLKKAQDITDEVFKQTLGIIRPGMTEKELTAEIIYRFYLLGADGLSFPPIVVSGPNTSLPHGVPSDRKLREGDFVTMDIGCVKDGYCSDMTRTVALGSATDEMKEVYRAVLAAQLAGIKAAKAGVTGSEIDGAARKVIADAGFGEFFGHGFGHGLGLEIHEAPNANASNDKSLPVGAVISAEPGIYLPGKFGVRIEDVVYITEDGCINITHSPKELLIL